MKRIISILMCMMLVLVSIPSHSIWAIDNTVGIGTVKALEGYIQVAESDMLKLYYNQEKIAIGIEDKRSGEVWKSCVDESQVNLEGMNEAFIQNIQSLFILTYRDLAKDEENATVASMMRLNPEVQMEVLEKGMRLTFNLKSLKTMFAMEFYLEGDSLRVCIPEERIKESVGAQEELSVKMETVKQQLQEIERQVEALKAIRLGSDVKSKVKKVWRSYKLLNESLMSMTDVWGISDEADRSLSYIDTLRGALTGSNSQFGLIDDLRKLTPTEEVGSAVTQIGELTTQIDKLKEEVRGLKELKTIGIIEIEVLPFFGAATNQEEGYAFYPDGSGALTYFGSQNDNQHQFFKREIFSTSTIELDSLYTDHKNRVQEVMLPVFGLKKSDHALLGAVTEGEAEGSIAYYPSGYQVDLHRAYATFTYRRSYESVTKNWLGITYKTVEKERVPGDREVTYFFLNGDAANYSGMANRYRTYLQDTDQLRQSRLIKEEMPIALDLVMGAKEDGVLWDKLVKATTFEEATEIVTRLNSQGVEHLQLNLMGWSKLGIGAHPAPLSIARGLGGSKGLEDLKEVVDAMNSEIFLQYNPIDAQKKVGGFSVGKDAVRLNNGKQATDFYKDYYLLSPAVAVERFLSPFTHFLNKENIAGVAIERIGSYVYNDYNKKSLYTRQQTTLKWQELLSTTYKNQTWISSSGGNQYVLQYADRLTDIPLKGTGYFIQDESIPFYQMVVHGLIPYTSKPFNLFYDKQYEKLRAIEYGCIPYYQMTYKPSEVLQYTNYNELFSSEFNQWEKEIVSIYKEFNDNLAQLQDQQMIAHEKIKENVYGVTYSNGTKVYINYSTMQQEVDGYRIEPEDYLLVQ